MIVDLAQDEIDDVYHQAIVDANAAIAKIVAELYASNRDPHPNRAELAERIAGALAECEKRFMADRYDALRARILAKQTNVLPS